jgi:hypothetical protein
MLNIHKLFAWYPNNTYFKVSPHMALWMGFIGEKSVIFVKESTPTPYLNFRSNVESDLASFSSAHLVRHEEVLS